MVPRSKTDEFHRFELTEESKNALKMRIKKGMAEEEEKKVVVPDFDIRTSNNALPL